MTNPSEQNARIDVVRSLAEGINVLEQEERRRNARTLSIDRARAIMLAKLTGETPDGDRVSFGKERFFGRLFTISEYDELREQINTALDVLVESPSTIGAESTADGAEKERTLPASSRARSTS